MTLKTVFVYWTVALCLLLAAAPAWAGTTLLVVGDSLSAAYGMQRSDGWVALLEQRLAQRLDGKYTVVNASISGETTAGGLRRLPDLLDRHDPDIVILELGANDGLNALSPAQMQANLAAMIEQSQNAGARIL
ncbi:MAG: GDSL-type esterase/lipase family protein, partial [Luteimonas sp.]|nr:GDSL-type esterase/lipase family protein [Luteimonas sp.]